VRVGTSREGRQGVPLAARMFNYDDITAFLLAAINVP